MRHIPSEIKNMTSYQLTVEELEVGSRTRAENMDLRHKDCKGPVDFKVMEDNNGEYWHLKCVRCYLKTVIQVGEDTKAIAMTAIDGRPIGQAKGD